MTQPSTIPNVLHYSNYRQYLKEFYLFKKSKNPDYSYRLFSKRAGISSPNYLKLIIDGKRNLSKKSMSKFLIALELTGGKAEFFENLVFFNQCETSAEKKVYYEKLLKMRTRSGLKQLHEEQFKIFSKWYHTIIREMVCLRDFNPNPGLIAKKLGHGMTAQKVKESLDLLIKAGLLQKSANGYIQRDSNITTSDEVRSLMVKNYHHEMMDLAGDALDNVASEKRDISSVTLSIKRKDLSKLKEQIQLMRKELLNLAADKDAAEEIVQVNIQMFPVTTGN